jgi:tRNA(Ile)-lysidine synthase
VRGRWLILHFDHALRGRASTADARFVAALARGLDERCVVERWRKPGRGPAIARASAGRPKAPVSEAGARDARFAFFARAMAEAGASVLALGHQRDDVAETMLMRLCRGSGTGGLAAPRPVQPVGGRVHVRPLLELTAEALRGALRAAGVPWREDATNAGDAFFRNRVRRRVLPSLAEASPADPVAGMALSRALLEDDDRALHAWLGELAGAPAAGEPWDVRALAGRPRALARRAVHAWLSASGVGEGLGRSAVEAIVASVHAGEDLRASVGAGRFARVRGGRLALETAGPASAGQRWPEQRLAVGETLCGPDGSTLAMRRRVAAKALVAAVTSGRYAPGETVFLAPPEGWAGWFLVRGRRAGDRYRPLGAPGRATLQNLFVDKKIPRERRDRLPVVCTENGEPVWVPGLPPAAAFAITEAGGHVVQLTYRGAGNNVGALHTKA